MQYMVAVQHTDPKQKSYAEGVVTAYFDNQHEKYNWKCVVGTSAGVDITHDTKYYVHFKVGDMDVYVYTTGPR
jgi:hypothetical protein